MWRLTFRDEAGNWPRMALYHGFSGKSGAQDLVTRLDDTLHWGLRHWRSFALAGALLLLALGGYAGYTSLLQHKALAASTALYALQTSAAGAATAPDAAAWLALAGQYPGTLPGQLARLRAARFALDAGNVTRAREVLQPLLTQRQLPPLVEEAVYQWLAVSHEQASDWNSAADWYRRILAIRAPEVDHPRALRNAVRVLRLAGMLDAARELLHSPALTRADPALANTVEAERLWLIAGE